MKYLLKYLPVDKPLTDGCTIIDIWGTHQIYNSTGSFSENYIKTCKVAELFFVSYAWNEMKIMGRPAPDVLKWLKPGEWVKAIDCQLWYKTIDGGLSKSATDNIPLSIKDLESHCFRVRCPTCGVLH